MDGNGLDSWRRRMGYGVREACESLGISYGTWRRYRSLGEIPKAVDLACKAIYHRLDEAEDSSGVTAKAKRQRRVSPASLANLKKGR